MKRESGFQALDVATQAATACVELCDNIRKPFGDAVSQLTRAALSIPLNIAEGSGRIGKARVNHYRIAYGSARESVKVVEILMALNRVDPKQAKTCLNLLDRVGAMCWRLTH